MDKSSESEMPEFCPLCEKSRMVFFHAGLFNRQGFKDYPYELFHCKVCDFYSVSPKPNHRIYPTTRDTNNEFVPYEGEWKWGKNIMDMILSHKSSGRLLDIGCQTGIFMDLAEKHGFKTLGVEIDEVLAAEGQKTHENILKGDFLEMEFLEKFDVIVLNHVLEHIPDIKKVPGKLASLLEKNGILIINVPNINGIIAKLMMDNWCAMAPFTHFWFFTRKSINVLFQNDFLELEIFTNTNAEPIEITNPSAKLILKNLIARVANGLNLGDEMRVLIKAPIRTPTKSSTKSPFPGQVS